MSEELKERLLAYNLARDSHARVCIYACSQLQAYELHHHKDDPEPGQWAFRTQAELEDFLAGTARAYRN